MQPKSAKEHHPGCALSGEPYGDFPGDECTCSSYDTYVLNVADLHSKSHPGKTWRQVNAEKKHDIPIGTIVEISDDELEHYLLRLFVVQYSRDCDQTPLYDLSYLNPEEFERKRQLLIAIGAKNPGLFLPSDHSYSKESLRVIKLPG